MAVNTYVELQRTTVSGTSTTSVTLSGISGSYTDLRLIINSQNQNSTYQPYIQFNSDTGTGTTNYSTTALRGDGSSVSSGRHTNQIGWYPVPGPGAGTTGNFQPWLVDIMNYSSTSTFKSGISRFNNPASVISSNTHLWRSSAAITSITITAESGSGYIASGSTFSLYGIKAADAIQTSPKASGGYVYQDSSYWYHVFAASSTFTPNQSLSADVLCVAGGGGGGTQNRGGGGGAGGVIYFAGQSLTATGYTCTIGAGGAGFTNGVNSQFGSLTVASGGGRGGASNFGGAYLASAGGSGGGNGNDGTNNGGASNQSSSGATAIYGNRGGNASVAGDVAGGGGAGAAGTDGVNTNNGIAGGIGTNAFASWLSATGMGHGGGYIAAGGNGGANASDSTNYLLPTRPLGGGGANAVDLQIANGIASTGSGGSGFSYNSGYGTYNAGSGGSGLIIVRYAK